MAIDLIINKTHCHPIKKILIVEDSAQLHDAIAENIAKKFSILCDVSCTEKQAMDLLSKNTYDLVICDLYLPDGKGDIIGYLLRKNIKVLVITGTENEEQRKKLTSLPIVDYIEKSDKKTLLNYLNNTIKRLIENEKNCILICDDSKVVRLRMIQTLQAQNIQYISAEDGLQAYNYIMDNEGIVNLLITDINMPNMDGIELTRKLRHKYDQNELPILSLSATGDSQAIPRILKSGANDFLSKPIQNEEFLTRFNACLDRNILYKQNKILLQKLNQLATVDNLTQVYNRNYFNLTIKKVLASTKRNNQLYGILILDLDNFKSVNDTYGHNNGDIVLVSIASVLQKLARESDYIFRWGGEEFILLVQNTNLEDLLLFAERIRSTIAETSIELEDTNREITVKTSVSIGVNINDGSADIKDVIHKADKNLYMAKESGKNRILYK